LLCAVQYRQPDSLCAPFLPGFSAQRHLPLAFPHLPAAPRLRCHSLPSFLLLRYRAARVSGCCAAPALRAAFLQAAACCGILRCEHYHHYAALLPLPAGGAQGVRGDAAVRAWRD